VRDNYAEDNDTEEESSDDEEKEQKTLQELSHLKPGWKKSPEVPDS
jgi:hypothetical protein